MFQRGQSSESLFDFLAEAVAELTKSGKLGFTFSFPVAQKSLTSGVLLRWTKSMNDKIGSHASNNTDFTVPGVIGEDVCKLLDNSFQKQGMDIHVAALISDTVGTQLSGAYQAANLGVSKNGKCFAGLILGTGTNVCYWEKIDRIHKLDKAGLASNGGMIINCESGNFGSREGFVGTHLPMNEFDIAVDEHSPNKGGQLLEKQISGRSSSIELIISGMYLGEIWRLVISKYVASGALFSSFASDLPALR